MRFHARRQFYFIAIAWLILANISCGKIWQKISYLDCGDRYVAQVLSDNPVGYWRLNETSGMVAYDLGSAGNNLIYAGGADLGQPSPLVGGSSYSAAANGNSVAGLSSNTVGLANSSNSFTVEMWIKLTSPSTRGSIDFANSMYTEGFAFSVNEAPCSSGQYKLTKFGHPDICVNGWPNDVNVWHHLAMVANNLGMTVYLDGNFSASSSDVNNYVACDSSCYLGLGYMGSLGFIEEVAFYLGSLTQTRIQAHYNAGITCNN